MNDAGAELRARLRADLLAALRDLRAAEVAELRLLIAALDDAAAVAVDHSRYRPRTFGASGVEVPRVQLDNGAVATILARQLAARRNEAAYNPRAAAMPIIARYLPLAQATPVPPVTP